MVDEWGYVAPISCYWCGASGDAVDELYHAEGARLAGSPPLPLPRHLSEREPLPEGRELLAERVRARERLRRDVPLRGRDHAVERLEARADVLRHAEAPLREEREGAAQRAALVDVRLVFADDDHLEADLSPVRLAAELAPRL